VDGDVISNTSIAQVTQYDPAYQEAHSRRFETFEAHADEFWEAYCLFAAEDWKAAVGELFRWEIEEAYEQLGVDMSGIKTEQQARRDAANRFVTYAEKSEFWRLANRHFIYEDMLNIGPDGWIAESDAKRFGPRRVRFTVMHFPMAAILEPTRTKHIAALFRRDKGDNAFFFRMIAQQQDEIARLRERNQELQRTAEAKAQEVAAAQKKLSAAYAELREERDKKAVFYRSQDDVRKIAELKSFVRELMEWKRANEVAEEPEEQPPVEILEETEGTPSPATTPDWSKLQGQTVSIIGGWRKEAAAREYPCTILTHDGRKHDPDFDHTLREADIIVVLTRFVGHSAMWAAKAWAIEHDTPILYLSEINMTRILDAAASVKKEISSL